MPESGDIRTRRAGRAAPLGRIGAVAVVLDVDSAADPRVDDFRDLKAADRRPDRPGGRGLVIAEGTVVVRRMLDSPFRPHAVLGVDKRWQELVPDLADSDIPFYRASAEVMAEVVGFHLNRGVLAVAHRPPAHDFTELVAGAATVAVLEGVNDHENLGAMFRNAAGLGVDAVLFGPGCADPLYRRSVRVSMGHALRVPFAQVPEWPSGLELLRRSGFQVVALSPDPAAATLATALTGRRVALLLGAEGPGLTEEAMAAADIRARIPMSTGTDSLNVATAAAMAFYERVRG